MNTWHLSAAVFFAATALLQAEAKVDPLEAAREIDALLAVDWEAHDVEPNPPAGDETFVRRAYLDIAGRIPTRLEALRFLENTEPDKRAKLIDELLASEAWWQHMFHFWADILRLQTRPDGGQGDMTAKPYIEHVKKRLRENQPYDQFVRELITAQGKVWDNPAIGYYMRDIGMPLDNLAITTRIFLGTRIECAQCHNHPFDKWTQMQFYQLAAFTYPQETNYAGIAAQDDANHLRRQAERRWRELIAKGSAEERTEASQDAARARRLGSVFENLGDFVRYSKVQALPSRQLKLPRDYQYPDAKPHDPVSPFALFGEAVACEPGKSVEAFGDWVASPENPRFTTVIANRLWKRAFGLGLIEPVDEMMDDTSAVNPELMKYLEQLMIDCGYDIKAFLRVLYLTETWQREVTRAEAIAGEAYRFPGPVLRRLTAEQLWDSFVTLVHPTPELPRRYGIDPDMAERMAYRGKLSDALDLMTAEEIFEGALKASSAYAAVSERSEELGRQYAAAQEAKDKPLIEKLSNEIRALNFTARSSINDHIVIPAVARLYTTKTGQPAPPPPTVNPEDAAEMMKPGRMRPYISVPGYQLGETFPAEEAAAEEARTAIFLEEARIFKIPAEDLDRYLAARRNHFREWPRAVHLDSPAPRGHYLREFGQSDRNMVENANFDASVPQALVLMNSRLVPQILSPWSQLSLSIGGLEDSEAQAEAVYLTLLSRKATAVERVAWIRAKESGLDSIEDLVFAIVNSRQFMFVR